MRLMHYHAFLLLPMLLGAVPLGAQRTEVVRRSPSDTTGNSYRIY